MGVHFQQLSAIVPLQMAKLKPCEHPKRLGKKTAVWTVTQILLRTSLLPFLAAPTLQKPLPRGCCNE